MTDNAMTGLATGQKKNKRKQDILTPQVVVDFVCALWGSTIQLDPCASRDPRCLVYAANRIYEPSDNSALGGLGIRWMDRTYVNPPYKHLKAWAAKAMSEAFESSSGVGFHRIALLGPTRGHRNWWHDARTSADVAIELKPLAFVGYPGTFPAPLTLLLWNGAPPARVHEAILQTGLGVTKTTFL